MLEFLSDPSIKGTFKRMSAEGIKSTQDVVGTGDEHTSAPAFAPDAVVSRVRPSGFVVACEQLPAIDPQLPLE